MRKHEWGRVRSWAQQVCLAGACVMAIGATTAQAKDGRLLEGEPLLPCAYEQLVELTSNERATMKCVPVDGMHFDEALRIVNHRQMQNVYDFQAVVSVPSSVATGQLLHVQFYARGKATKSASGEAQAEVYFQQRAPDYQKDLSKRFTVGAEWTRFDYSFTTTRPYDVNASALCFGTGYGKQELEIGGVHLLRFGADVKASDLPSIPLRYEGSGAEAPWRADAAKRIERYRKGDLVVHVIDAEGKPVAGVPVKVDMLKHAFHFSSIIQAHRIVDNSAENETYKNKVLELFNASGTENALKWEPWVGDWGDHFTREKTIGAIKWLRKHGLHVRGHVMVWPGWDHVSSQAKGMQEAPAGVPEMVRQHILDMGKATRPYIDEWDVINETRDNHDLMDLFGRDIMVDWFRYAREAHPTAGLYINDFGIMDGGSLGSPNHVMYHDTIKFLIENGAPISGIGFQSHFHQFLPCPATVVGILDSFGRHGLDMRITEFDINSRNEEVQANYTRDFMTAVFSHPKVVGFQVWGFWQKAHWRPSSAMYRDNWEEKLNGAAYRDLVFNQWWTSEQGQTDDTGEYRIRGFKGLYDVCVTTAQGDLKASATIGTYLSTVQVKVEAAEKTAEP